jgi:hypothetical protein
VTARKSRKRGLAIVYQGRARTGNGWGTRVLPDGRAEEWTDLGTWEPLVHLDDAAMASLREAVAESGFFELPESIAPDRPVRDGTMLTWEIELDGRKHSVTARHSAASPDPVLAKLDEELQRVVGEALNREADDEE